MSKKVELLKKLGGKAANISIEPFCFPYYIYQPKPPAKIQAKMKNK